MIVALTVLFIVFAILFLAYVERLDGPEIDAQDEGDEDWHNRAEAVARQEAIDRADIRRFTGDQD